MSRAGFALGSPTLPEDFVEHDAHAGRHVHRAQSGVRHGQGDEPIGVARALIGREADALPAEDHHGPRGVAHVPVAARGVRADEEGLPQLGERRLEGGEAGPQARRHPRPVVEPGPAHLALVQGEAEGLDEVELGARSQAGASGVAGVPVDLGLHEHNVQRGVVAGRLRGHARRLR